MPFPGSLLRRRPPRWIGRWIMPLGLISSGPVVAQDLLNLPAGVGAPQIGYGLVGENSTEQFDAGHQDIENPGRDGFWGGGEALTSPAAAGWVRDSLFAPSPVNAGRARLTLESPLFYDFGGLVGLRQATPENATFKAGNFYLKVASVSGSVLHSDNINWAPTHPETGTIAILRLGTVVMYQIADNLQLAVGGTFIYLPIEGKAGVSGFGILDPLYAFATRPIFRAELTYELHAGEWEVRLANEFRIIAALSAPAGLGFDFREQSQAGQYVFYDRYAPVGVADPFVLRENRTGASANRLLPTETRLTLGANRSYYWYDGTVLSRFPTRRDTGYVALNSELKDLRFKPFAFYKIDRYDVEQYNHQQIRGGFRGPVTENIAILGDGGYFWQDGVGRQGVLWDARIQQTVSPQLSHQISYGRYITEPFGDSEERVMYSIRDQLNSVISVGANAYSTRFEVLDRSSIRGNQRGVNVGIRGEFFPEGGAELGGGWLRESYDNMTTGSRDTWLARARLRYKTVEAELVYRFLDRQSVVPGLRYRENLVAFTLSKYF